MDNIRNSFLNLLKAIACICILFAHVRFPGLFGKIVVCFSQFGVPLFFAISGYYSFNIKLKKIKNRIFNILRIFLFGLSFCFVFCVLSAVKDNNLLNWLVYTFNIKRILKGLILCFDFAPHLWYLNASIKMYIFWYIIVKHNKQDKILKFLPLMFLLSVFQRTLCENLNLFIDIKYSMLFTAMPWFCFGYYCKINENFLNFNIVYLIVTSFFGLLIILIDTLGSVNIHLYYIGTILHTIPLFIIAIKYPNIKVNKFINYIGDSLSMYIYIYHIVVSNILLFIANILDLKNDIYLFFHPIVTLIVTILFSIISNKLYKRIINFLEKSLC